MFKSERVGRAVFSLMHPAQRCQGPVVRLSGFELCQTVEQETRKKTQALPGGPAAQHMLFPSPLSSGSPPPLLDKRPGLL